MAEDHFAMPLHVAARQGFAYVRVTCLPQTVAAIQSTRAQNTSNQPPLSPSLSWQELQGHSASPEKSSAPTRGGFLGTALGAASNALRAIANPARSKLLLMLLLLLN